MDEITAQRQIAEITVSKHGLPSLCARIDKCLEAQSLAAA